MIAGNIAGRATSYFADCVCKAIPDGFALAVFIPRALNLIGSRGKSPQEPVRKTRTGNIVCSRKRCETALREQSPAAYCTRAGQKAAPIDQGKPPSIRIVRAPIVWSVSSPQMSGHATLGFNAGFPRAYSKYRGRSNPLPGTDGKWLFAFAGCLPGDHRYTARRPRSLLWVQPNPDPRYGFSGSRWRSFCAGFHAQSAYEYFTHQHSDRLAAQRTWGHRLRYAAREDVSHLGRVA